MLTREFTKTDYDYIVSVLDQWFGGLSHDRAHPVFFYELGSKALIAEEFGEVVGFLLGFTTEAVPPEPVTGYIHFVGIKPESRRQGVGRLLYDTFIKQSVAAGAKRIKAIAPIGNDESALLTLRTEETGALALANHSNGCVTKFARQLLSVIHHGLELEMTRLPVRTGKIAQRAAALGHCNRQHLNNARA